MRELIDFLKPLKDLRLKLCSETMPTLLHVFPEKEKLKIDIKNFKTNFRQLDTLKTKMIEAIDSYLVITDYHIIATFLTPIYRKLKMFSNVNEIK